MVRPSEAQYSEVPPDDAINTDRASSGSDDDTRTNSRRFVIGVLVSLACCAALATAAWTSGNRSVNRSGDAGFLERADGTNEAPTRIAGDWFEDQFIAAQAKVSEKWMVKEGVVGKLRDPDVTEIPANHIMTLYHQTSPEACAGIMKTDFRLGSGGWCGKGVYFALSPMATKLKSVAPGSGHGCMMEVEVDVGKIQRFQSCGLMHTMDGHQLARRGYDSILFEPPEATGDEIIIFDTTRVLSKKLIPFKEEWRSQRWYGNNGGWR